MCRQSFYVDNYRILTLNVCLFCHKQKSDNFNATKKTGNNSTVRFEITIEKTLIQNKIQLIDSSLLFSRSISLFQQHTKTELFFSLAIPSNTHNLEKLSHKYEEREKKQ